MSGTHIGNAGSNYYAKPWVNDAFDTDPTWQADAIAGVPNGSVPSLFTFATNDAIEYKIFLRATATPLASDEIEATLPAQPAGIYATTNRGAGRTIEFKVGEICEKSRSVVDENGDAVTLTGMTLELVIETLAGVDVAVIDGVDLTLSGSSFTFTSTAAMTLTPRILTWSLRVVSTQEEIAAGLMPVVGSPLEDAA